jgi:putative DNA primase/helicase
VSIKNTGVFTIAADYVGQGLSVLPIRVDGSKAPALPEGQVEQFRTRRPNEPELRGWFETGRRGIGILGGPASGNLVVLDFETDLVFRSWGDRLTAEDRGTLEGSPVVRTPGGGWHVYLRTAEPVRGCKLARTAAGECLVETRGHGHYVVAPGSPARCHPTNRPYLWVRRGWVGQAPGREPCPTPLEAFHALTVHAAGLNEYVKPAPREIVGDRSGPATGDRPGDHFNARAAWGDILTPHGWKVYRPAGPTTFWCRPGKSPAGISASTGFCRGPTGNDLLYVFSTSAAPFEAELSYSKFAAYTLLNHRGDFAAATKALVRAGYGRGREEWSRTQPRIVANGRRFTRGRATG